MATARLLKNTIFASFLVASFSLISACNSTDKEEPASAKEVVEQAAPKEATAQIEETPAAEKEALNRSSFSWLKLSGWHTKGTISRDTSIRIVFNRNIVDKEFIGKNASKVMHIAPAIEGNPIFKSQTEIVWKPVSALQDGAEYKVSIQAKGLKDVPVNTAPYQFSFQVIPLEFEVKTLGLSSLPDNENQMNLKGQLLTSDRVSSTLVETTLKASQQGNALDIDWSHGSNGRKHNFSVKKITRETFATNVVLKWDGKPINIKNQGQKEILIPTSDEFKVTSTRVIHDVGSNLYVQLRFSDQLDESQNIKGLVQLAKNKYKVSINGNVVNIYPARNLSGSFKVKINKGIKSKAGKILNESIEKKIAFDDIKPQVRFVGSGSILPENSSLEIPFEAVGINAVEVTALEIFPDNMGQFLQNNRISGGNTVDRTGRYLWRKTIPLTPADPNKWNRYSFNVTELMEKHHAGLLRLTLTIRKQHSTYRCASKQSSKTRKDILRNMEDNGVYETVNKDTIPEDNNGGGNYYEYDWDNRNDPCFNAYFGYYNRSNTTVSQNFIASNIGLIAKQDKYGNLHIITTDIRTAEPLTGVDLAVKNFQGQELATAKSDGNGFAQVKLDATPFVVVAKKFKDTAYLKVNARTALAISHFDVSGKKIKKGIKGVIYGERGVWRPGDDIFLTFVLQDKIGKIPDGHPVTMKLIDPRGRTVESKTSTASVGGFYAFKFKTKEKALTGNYTAKAFLGGSTFSKSLMIETIRPNRLRIDLNFDTASSAEPVIYSADGKATGTLFSQWLHGATASKLKADIMLRFSAMKTHFKDFSDFSFDDPARNLKSEEIKLLEGYLDDQGKLTFDKSLQPESKAPGMLKARFTSRVFEKGGAFSISRNSFTYHPYKNYIGLKLPKSEAFYDLLHTDKTHTIQIASVSAKGDPVSLQKVRVSLYKIDWRWWWDRQNNSLAEFADGKHTDLLDNTIISTVDGKGQWDFNVKQDDWGRYLVRVCDLQGQHCAGKTVYIDWPNWSGRAQKSGGAAASRLSLFSDKEAYTVGETATIQLPAAKQGRALFTIETGSRILEQRWINLNEAKTTVEGKNKVQVEIPITADMSPNAYVHISLIQPHKDKKNDRPIRLYGIIPLEVADPTTYLKPKIEVAEEWKPESKQSIKVSESSGKSMNYTLAVVDEGLLGLTAFKTPDLHRHFYSKEALGVNTWDLFDSVIGAYGGKLERMLALGGGDGKEVDNEDSKKRRFPPVVKFLGPFNLKAGESAQHEVQLPPYLGAVRVMLIAGEQGAYGKTQESVFIRQPLMLQASLPRTLGPDEDVAVPVTLFAMSDDIKDVSLKIETDDLVNIVGDAETQITFDQMGEKLAFIKLKTANRIGKTHLHFIATAMTEKGEQKSEADVYLNISQPNEATSRSVTQLIEPDTNWTKKANAYGLEGTNEALLEISSVPPLNMEKRLDYLIRYPHGCLEQTTSSVFPQLFLSNVMTLDKKKQEETERNIKRGIERLRRFQRNSGNFSYWPGGDYSNNWASIYAGHFLTEAKKKGYLIPQDLLDNWLNFQVDEAQNYVVGSDKYSHPQAYRLYVLAQAGKAQMGAMNRLREYSKLNNKARWLLASAYQSASQPEAAKSVVEGLLPEVDPVMRSDRTFSSTLGDLGLQLESLVALNKKQDANKLLEKIAEQMKGNRYQSTQGIAWALMAVSRYLGGDTSSFTAKLSQDGSNSDINSDKPISTIRLSKADANIELKNTSGIRLFATLVNRGVPQAGDEISLKEGIGLQVIYEYRDKENAKLWHEITDQKVPQGRDVRIAVTVTNETDYYTENIALTIPVAAGMEILSASEQPENKVKFDYRDLRDDRVHYYFYLQRNRPKTFYLLANAAYKGRYYLPAVNVEAMYEGNMKARQKGQWITIYNPKDKVPEEENNDKENKQASIKSLKAYLYDEADETSRTAMYLVIGDKVKILKETKTDDNSRWLFIHFEGTKVLEKWIRAETIE